MGLSISRSDLEQVRRLWAELAECPAATPMVALDHALARLGNLIGVERIWWLGSRRGEIDPHRPWRGWEVAKLHYHNGTFDDQRTVDLLMESARQDRPPLFHALRARIDGDCHIERPFDLMDRGQWYGDWYYQEILRPVGQDAQMVGTFRTSSQLAGHFGMDRATRAAHFSDRERDLLEVFLVGMTALQHDLFRFHGLECSESVLAPREQDVLGLLLTDLSEKQIAAELGLTVRTTHQYVTGLFRQFGVSGRRGLMALFLRHGVRNPPDH